MRKLIVVAALVGVFIYLKKRFGQDNELQAELREQRKLQGIGAVATAAAASSSDSVPLSMIGDQPLAGIWLDPFNPQNIAARPKGIDFYPSSIFMN